MGHGGKRQGAGRRKGSASRKTREIADRATAEGLPPLEVMLAVMRSCVGDDGKISAENRALALAAATRAAPYMHPRLTAVEHSGAAGGPVQFVMVAPAKAGSAEEWAKRHGGAT